MTPEEIELTKSLLTGVYIACLISSQGIDLYRFIMKKMKAKDKDGDA